MTLLDQHFFLLFLLTNFFRNIGMLYNVLYVRILFLFLLNSFSVIIEFIYYIILLNKLYFIINIIR